jgi:hypothetical protein
MWISGQSMSLNSSSINSSSSCNHHNSIKQTAMVMIEEYPRNHNINDTTNTLMDSGSGLLCKVHEQQQAINFKEIQQQHINSRA